MSAETENAVVRDLAQSAAEPHEPYPGVTAYRLPAGARLELVEHELYATSPDRARGLVTVNDVRSLGAYLTEQGSDTRSTLWVDLFAARVTAVLDDHSDDGDPGWGEHRVNLDLKVTPEWHAWLAASGELLEQEAFAEFVEENLNDVVTPDGASLLEIAQTFHATTSAEFKGSVRLGNGQATLSYSEETTAAAGANRDMQIPTEIHVALAPYYGLERVFIKARLRWRIREGKLRLGVKLERPEEARLEALKRLAEKLREEHARTFIGSPRAPGSSRRSSG